MSGEGKGRGGGRWERREADAVERAGREQKGRMHQMGRGRGGREVGEGAQRRSRRKGGEGVGSPQERRCAAPERGGVATAVGPLSGGPLAGGPMAGEASATAAGGEWEPCRSRRRRAGGGTARTTSGGAYPPPAQTPRATGCRSSGLAGREAAGGETFVGGVGAKGGLSGQPLALGRFPPFFVAPGWTTREGPFRSDCQVPDASGLRRIGRGCDRERRASSPPKPARPYILQRWRRPGSDSPWP